LTDSIGERAISAKNSAEAEAAKYKDSVVVPVGPFKVGLIHGHQVVPWNDRKQLAFKANELNCDILVHGHCRQPYICGMPGETGTEENATIRLTAGSRALVCPGSVTGSQSALGEEEVHPSFMLMALQGNSMTVYTYMEVDGEAKVSMKEIKKD